MTSLAAAIVRDGSGFGILLWATLTSAAAIAIAFAIAVRASQLRQRGSFKPEREPGGRR